MSGQERSKDLNDMYAAKIRGDLARVEEEMAALRSRLDQLGADRGWLLELLSHLPSPSAAGSAAQSATPPDAETPGETQGSGADTGARGSVPRRRRARGELTLRELVVRHLEKQGGPTTVHEATTTVNSSGQVRQASTVVVRNTLEALVARGVAARSKEGRSVFYTLLPPADATA